MREVQIENANYRMIFNAVNDAILIYDLESRTLIDANHRALELYGSTFAELQANSYLTRSALVPPYTAEKAHEYIQRAIDKEPQLFEWLAQNKQGQHFLIEVNLKRTSIDNREMIIAVIRDISERQKTSKALNESERRFRVMLESVNLLAVMLDTQGNVTFCNDFLLSITGYESHEVLGKNWFDLFCPLDKKEQFRSDYPVRLKNADIPIHYENFILTKTGEARLISWDNTILFSPQDWIIGTASLGRDITELRLLEEQYRQAQKMEAIGQLAGGVAHDFNNLLSVILGYAEMALLNLKMEEDYHEEFQQIHHTALRAKDLTRQLLAFSRKQVLEIIQVDVNDVIRNINKMLARLIGEDIQIVTKISPTPHYVKVDISQLELVIINLALNARDAMPKGGKLMIETSAILLDKEYTFSHAQVKPGDYAMLSISDTGAGMHESVRSRIFEPFFTTKDKGKGTGLGLATVYGIIKQHGGEIWCYSEEGNGTTFKIYLPLIIENSVRQQNTPHFLLSSPGNQTVLVVEDDAPLRKIICSLLRKHGYRVLESKNGQDAIRIASESTEIIHLLLTDVIMPNMNGKQVYESVSVVQPEISVLFMSGYSEEVIEHIGVLGENSQLIQKPFATHELLTRIRELIA